MGNTIDINLVTDTVATEVLTTLTEVLAPLSSFSTDFGIDQLKPGVDVQVPVVEDGDDTRINTTDWEQGDTVIGSRKVEMKQLTKSAQLLGNSIMDMATAPMTIANFGAGITVDPSTFGATDLQNIWGSSEKMMDRNIILSGDLYSKFLPTNLDSFDPTKSRTGLFGFGEFNHNGRWDGAGPNVRLCLLVSNLVLVCCLQCGTLASLVQHGRLMM